MNYTQVVQAREGECARGRHLPWQVQPGEARREGEAGGPRQEEGEGEVLLHIRGYQQVVPFFVIELLTSSFQDVHQRLRCGCDIP